VPILTFPGRSLSLTVRDTEKYRRRNPAQILPGLENFRIGVVIPCYNENAALGETLSSLKEALAESEEAAAVLVVVNHPAGADDTQSLLLCKLLEERAFDYPFLFFLYAPGLKGGVGEARKIGMDSFLQSRPAENAPGTLICSMDGDTLVDKSYFKEIITHFKNSTAGGVSISLRHRTAGNEEQEQAIRRYEAYLDCYAAQLKRCGSPYGFHTVGSAFAVTGEAYMKCGGMKVRPAGEDFYFLQEVAKTSGVSTLDKVLVFPSPRISDRTPFGTGQAVKDIMAGKPLSEVSDRAFDRLKGVLESVSLETLDTDTPLLPEQEFFEAERFFKVWSSIRRNTPRTKLCSAFHIWFDGLKTLRFLHWCDA